MTHNSHYNYYFVAFYTFIIVLITIQMHLPL